MERGTTTTTTSTTTTTTTTAAAFYGPDFFGGADVFRNPPPEKRDTVLKDNMLAFERSQRASPFIKSPKVSRKKCKQNDICYGLVWFGWWSSKKKWEPGPGDLL